MKQRAFLQTARAAATLVILASSFLPAAAGAAGFCKLPDGSMGQTCVVAGSGQVYGCVKDLKECGALAPTAPSGDEVSRPDGGTTGLTPAPENGQKATKSRSNIQNN
ncbi:MAG: hypothetical protein AB7O49_14930 [Sphingomonadales bacterium]